MRILLALVLVLIACPSAHVVSQPSARNAAEPADSDDEPIPVLLDVIVTAVRADERLSPQVIESLEVLVDGAAGRGQVRVGRKPGPNVTVGEFLGGFTAPCPLPSQTARDLIEALEEHGHLEVRSTPQVLARDRQMSHIRLAAEESCWRARPLQFDVNVPRETLLNITPHVRDNNDVVLDMVIDVPDTTDDNPDDLDPSSRRQILADTILLPPDRCVVLPFEPAGVDNDTALYVLIKARTVLPTRRRAAFWRNPTQETLEGLLTESDLHQEEARARLRPESLGKALQAHIPPAGEREFVLLDLVVTAIRANDQLKPQVIESLGPALAQVGGAALLRGASVVDPNVTVGDFLKRCTRVRILPKELIDVLIESLKEHGHLEMESAPQAVVRHGRLSTIRLDVPLVRMPLIPPGYVDRRNVVGVVLFAAPEIRENDDVVLNMVLGVPVVAKSGQYDLEPPAGRRILSSTVLLPNRRCFVLPFRRPGAGEDTMLYTFITPIIVPEELTVVQSSREADPGPPGHPSHQ